VVRRAAGDFAGAAQGFYETVVFRHHVAAAAGTEIDVLQKNVGRIHFIDMADDWQNFIDMADDWQKKNFYPGSLVDPMHLSIIGHTLTADYLAGYLLPFVKARCSTPAPRLRRGTKEKARQPLREADRDSELRDTAENHLSASTPSPASRRVSAARIHFRAGSSIRR
jgi:hypothetical protein